MIAYRHKIMDDYESSFDPYQLSLDWVSEEELPDNQSSYTIGQPDAVYVLGIPKSKEFKTITHDLTACSAVILYFSNEENNTNSVYMSHARPGYQKSQLDEAKDMVSTAKTYKDTTIAGFVVRHGSEPRLDLPGKFRGVLVPGVAELAEENGFPAKTLYYQKPTDISAGIVRGQIRPPQLCDALSYAGAV